MKLRQTVLALAIGAMAASAQAAIWTGMFQTNNGAIVHDGVIGPLSDMDLYSEGSAAFFCASSGGCGISGSIAPGAQLDPMATTLKLGDVVTTVYQGVVNAITPGVSSPNLRYPGQSGSYQITVAAWFQEVVTGGFGTTAILTGIPGGRISFFFDDLSLSNTFIDSAGDILTGKGYTDGMLFADGSITGAFSTFSVLSAGASGFADVLGKFTTVSAGSSTPDVVGFMPTTPTGFESFTTLQYKTDGSSTRTMNFFDSANGWTSISVNKEWTVQADANVKFHYDVPEPTTLALLGLGLAGLGFSLRRRAA